MARLCRYHGVAPRQLHDQLHRGEQCWQRCGRTHGRPRSKSQGESACSLVLVLGIPFSPEEAELNLLYKVLRDGRWSEQEAAILVPGDVISIKLGDIIPADARLLEGDPLKVDQSAITGESLPLTKNTGDLVFSGSTCKQGEIDAVVIATGTRTLLGKAVHLVESTEQLGHFQKVSRKATTHAPPPSSFQ